MSADFIELTWIQHGSEHFPDWVELRQRLLREPLGLRFTQADAEAEKDQLHLIAHRDGLLGGLILVPGEEGIGKIRQVVVDQNFQGSGLGKLLMAEAESHAKFLGLSGIYLHSRANVCAFYEKLGYISEGEIFEEVGIPHRRMRKSLEKSENIR